MRHAILDQVRSVNQKPMQNLQLHIYVPHTLDHPKFTPPLTQSPHNTFKCHQRHGIGRECPQETRHKPSPIAFPSILSTDRHSSISPPPVLSVLTQIIRHDTLLDDIRRIAGQPEDLRRQATSPEIDGRCGEGRVVSKSARDDIVRTPPEEEKRAEEQSGSQTMVYAPNAMLPEDLLCAINRPGIETFRPVGRVLYLQACLDMLHRRRDERHGGAGHDTCDCVSDCRQLVIQ